MFIFCTTIHRKCLSEHSFHSQTCAHGAAKFDCTEVLHTVCAIVWNRADSEKNCFETIENKVSNRRKLSTWKIIAAKEPSVQRQRGSDVCLSVCLSAAY